MWKLFSLQDRGQQSPSLYGAMQRTGGKRAFEWTNRGTQEERSAPGLWCVSVSQSLKQHNHCGTQSPGEPNATCTLWVPKFHLGTFPRGWWRGSQVGHKSVLYLICTCEQPPAPGSYRRPGKGGGGVPSEKESNLFAELKCSFSAGTLGDGGAVDKNGRQEENGHDQRVSASRASTLPRRGAQGRQRFRWRRGSRLQRGAGVGGLPARPPRAWEAAARPA